MKYENWLQYWKKSLSDSLMTNVDVNSQKNFEIDDFQMEVDCIDIKESNKLINKEEYRYNRKNGVEDNNSEKWVKIDRTNVLIAPFKIKPTSQHLFVVNNMDAKYPFWYSAILDRQGNLTVPEEIFPVFQRRFLEPLADERTDFIFTSIEKVDKTTTLGNESFDKYVNYIGYVRNIFEEAVGQTIDSYKIDSGYEVILSGTVLLPNEEINAAIGIIQLYEKILKRTNRPKLLERFISLKEQTSMAPISVELMIDVNHLHLGQMGYNFPISISQRKSLYTILNSEHNIFAVNGPPGTGKTTLIQSVVANDFVKSALKGMDAPIILACSANNQAVTNIIDSFSKSNTKNGKLQGRWLPNIEGYATYLPANSKLANDLKGINYKKLNGDGLFAKTETFDYLNRAVFYFESKYASYSGNSNVSLSLAIQDLQERIVENVSLLKQANELWSNYRKAENAFFTIYEGHSTSDYFANGVLATININRDIDELKKLEQSVIKYFNNESFFRKLFCFFGFKSTLKNRSAELGIILRESLINTSDRFVFKKGAILSKIDKTVLSLIGITKVITAWITWQSNMSVSGNPPRNESEYWKYERLKINTGLGPNCFFDELDVTLRHESFQLATHYWEARYLERLEDDLLDPKFKSKGYEPMVNRWKRQAMLTPCFVSTFYMAPKFFSSFKFLGQGDNGKNIFDNQPLFNFIDLLVVDEAGQVTPEVGIATFSLAKKALIVGDIKQIEPVWNISSKIDIGNLWKNKLIKNYDDLSYENEYDSKGFLASTGSLMKMAQNSCNIKDSTSNEKGMILLEHRRCFNEIINYCNVLAYDKKLIPLKGRANNTLFPPMYCIHVEGQSKKRFSSRFNTNEVNAIVDWLVENRSHIEKKYGKVEDSIGIITPFVAQKNSLSIALKKKGFDVYNLKLGTVHSLQGAERDIILFSMVYGENESGNMFFDRNNKPNMLNVAVSRAKESFIVFANTKILDKNSKSPSGLLANHLKYKVNTLSNNA